MAPQLTRSKTSPQKRFLQTALHKGWNGEESAKIPHRAAFHQLQSHAICSWLLWHQPISTRAHCCCRMMDIHPEKKPAPPCCSRAWLLTPIMSSPLLEESLPASLPRHLPLLQPLPSLPCPRPPNIPPLSFATDQCMLLCRILFASLSKGHCKQSLTPLMGETLGLLKKLCG